MPHPERPVDSMQLVIDNFRAHPEVAVMGGIETSSLRPNMAPSGHNPVHELDIFVHAVEPVLNLAELNAMLRSLAPAEVPPTKVEPFEILTGGYLQFGRLQFAQKLGAVTSDVEVVLYDHTLLSKDSRLAKSWKVEVVGDLWQRTRVRLFPNRTVAIEASHNNNLYGCFIGGLKHEDSRKRRDTRAVSEALLQTPLLKGVVRKYL